MLLHYKQFMSWPLALCDGKHWVPAKPIKGPGWFRCRLRAAWAVLRGDAVAVEICPEAPILVVSWADWADYGYPADINAYQRNGGPLPDELTSDQDWDTVWAAWREREHLRKHCAGTLDNVVTG